MCVRVRLRLRLRDRHPVVGDAVAEVHASLSRSALLDDDGAKGTVQDLIASEVPVTLSRCPTGEPAPDPSGLLASMTPCALDVPAGRRAASSEHACKLRRVRSHQCGVGAMHTKCGRLSSYPDPHVLPVRKAMLHGVEQYVRCVSLG